MRRHADGITCNKCGRRFDPATTPGGLLFSAPTRWLGRVRKYHLCARCTRRISFRFRR